MSLYQEMLILEQCDHSIPCKACLIEYTIYCNPSKMCRARLTTAEYKSILSSVSALFKIADISKTNELSG